MVDQTKIAELKAFAKLYGYVRYFHPSDQAFNLDWHAFAVYGARRVLEHSGTFDEVLKTLFLPIAPSLDVFPSTENPPPFRPPEGGDSKELVAWQHYGVGADSNHIYSSLRTNCHDEVTKKSRTGDFANIMRAVAVKDFQGGRFRIRASVKTTGQVQLWARVDLGSRKKGFFDNMADRPIRSKDWGTYEIEGEIDPNAVRVVFGAFLLGGGQCSIADFQLELKKDDEWQSIDLTEALSVGALGIRRRNWVKRGKPYSFDEVNDEEIQRPVLSIQYGGKPRRQPAKLYQEMPDQNAPLIRDLGQGVSIQMPICLSSTDRGRKHEMGESKADSYIELVRAMEESASSEESNSDVAVRIANLIIVWNLFQHFYPYFESINGDWEQHLVNALELAFTDQSEEDFLVTIQRMTAQLNDGHLRVQSESNPDLAQPKCVLDLVEEQIVVVACDQDTGLEVGDVIKEIDEASADERLVFSRSLVSGSEQWKTYLALQGFLRGPLNSRTKLGIRRQGEFEEKVLMRDAFTWAPPPKRSRFEEIQPGVMYVDLRAKLWPMWFFKLWKLAHAKGVIFDLRGYPSGLNLLVLRFLITQKENDRWMFVRKTIYPDQEKVAGVTGIGWNLKPWKPHIGGRVVFLTNANAISYSESIMGYVEHFRLGDIVGQATAGANGDVNKMQLVGGLSVRWTGLRVLKHDGSQHHTIGVQPTKEVNPTLQGIRDGVDEQLDAALEIVNRPIEYARTTPELSTQPS